MTPKKGDPVAPPPGKNEYLIKYDSRAVVDGWRELGNKAPGNTAKAWEAMRTDPCPHPETERHHQLKGSLSTQNRDGKDLPQWQIEVTGGGRVWYLLDSKRRIVWLTKASVGHPSETE
ncbi:hypothetical protein [Streptomyces sp. NBC_01261]|uniref:hypothetical protein n=1 Tax=unclassified Streptomyces TaxID=2593676 RepID=UPI002E30F4E6|nr:hypothetical protein [Streptomyces sp. NBC_01261]